MSLALHGHQILLLATLAFIAAVLIPSWYTTADLQRKRNVFDVCNTNPYVCRWTLVSTSSNVSLQTIFPLIAASAAIACAGFSLISLFLGSWYIQRFSGDIGSKWLLILTILCVLLSFVLSCVVWAIMLTTNIHQQDTMRKDIRLEEFGFSLWINIGASGAYFYTFFIYLIAVCKSC